MWDIAGGVSLGLVGGVIAIPVVLFIGLYLYHLVKPTVTKK